MLYLPQLSQMNRSVMKCNFPQKINSSERRSGVTVHALQSNSHLSIECRAKGQFEDMKDIQTRNEKSGKGERGSPGSFIGQ